jgi:hypothetical protein
MKRGRSYKYRVSTDGGKPFRDKNEKRGQLDRIEPPLFFGFFTVKFFSHLPVSIPNGPANLMGQRPVLGVGTNKRASDRHRRPVLTSETTKRKNSNIFHCSLFDCCVLCPDQDMLLHYTFLLVMVTIHWIRSCL